MASKYSKAEVAYTDHGKQDHCSICKHYLDHSSVSRCEIVEGKIVPGGWCRKFERFKHAGPPNIQSMSSGVGGGR